MQITTDVDMNGVAILGPAGDLDADTGEDLTEVIATVLTHYRVTHLVVDLAQVSSLEPAALSTLLRARRMVLEAGATFRVMRPHHTVRRLLHLAGTCQLLMHGRPPARLDGET
ncbi:STAS domain-containing protein [Micromonospora sp. NPDC051006]|uniref:STAS domain-containing protein n=1 Tax=Micromonospora sp. NPDC051006 TaxID=3364283 RepID=UPI00379EE78F